MKNNYVVRAWTKSNEYNNMFVQIYITHNDTRYVFNGYMDDYQINCLNVILNDIEHITTNNRNDESVLLNRWCSKRNIKVNNDASLFIPLMAIMFRKVTAIKKLSKN